MNKKKSIDLYKEIYTDCVLYLKGIEEQFWPPQYEIGHWFLVNVAEAGH